MENISFSERLKSLRKEKGITQEELAEKLFVSRTAVSKWESGVGYPSIESLRLLAEFFNVSIDEFISSNQMLSFAEKDSKIKKQKFILTVASILDVFSILLLFLPLFSMNKNGEIISISLIYAKDVQLFSQIILYLFIGGLTINGILGLSICNFDNKRFDKIVLIIGIVVSILLIAMLILIRMPYASIFAFILLIIKVFFIIKLK